MYSDGETHDAPQSKRKIPPASSMLWVRNLRRFIGSGAGLGSEALMGSYRIPCISLFQLRVSRRRIIVPASLAAVSTSVRPSQLCPNRRQPKYNHLKDLHKAIKRCEHALVSSDRTVTSLGTLQQAHVFSAGTAGCATFLANYHEQSAATVIFNNRHYELPPWSISILPDCRTSVFNTTKVRSQTSVVQMLPVNPRFSWETYDEDLSSLDKSSRITAARLLEHLNVARYTSDYLWYITRKDE